MYLITCILLSLMLTPVLTTIDITMAEMLYVANHIPQADCRRLMAALHSESYQLDTRLAEVGLVLSDTTPCIDLLVHWNSKPGEGKGKTQEILSRRLRQLGKPELAAWLSKTVFSQLAKHLDSLELTPDRLNDHTSNSEEVTTLEILENYVEEIIQEETTPFDSVWIAAIALLAVTLLILMLLLLSKFVSDRRRKWDKYEHV